MIELLVNGYAVDIPTFMYIWTGAALAGGLLTGLIGGATFVWWLGKEEVKR